MNEVRNILVGFDFGEKVSQLCYYDRREGEPVSLPVKVGTGQYTFPNVLSKKPGEEEWHFGLEVEYFVEQQEEIPVENLYTLCLKQETVEVDGATWKVGELLGKFIGNALRTCIATYAGTQPENVIVGNGSTELISLFIQTKHPKKALVLGPTYSEYEREIALGGGTTLYYPLKEEHGFHMDVEDLNMKYQS